MAFRKQDFIFVAMIMSFLYPWSRSTLKKLDDNLRASYDANEGGWVRQNTTVVGLYLLVRR